MKEGLLLDGIAVCRIDVPVGSKERASPVKTDLADAREAGRNGAAVAACKALYPGAVQSAVQFRRTGLPGELFGNGSHFLNSL
jgi:hypothetical protein